MSYNPLEHSFGTLRMKARYDDTIDKCKVCLEPRNHFANKFFSTK